jgi:hypothetical protein
MWQDTDSMGKNPFCEANTHLANYPHFTEPQCSLRGHKTPTLVPILRQMTAVHTLLLHLFKSHSNNVLPSKLVFPSGLHNKNHVSAYITSHAFYVSRPTHATLNHSNIIWHGGQTMKLFTMHYSFPLTSKYFPQHLALKDPQPAYAFFPQPERPRFIPYKPTSTVTVLYV